MSARRALVEPSCIATQVHAGLTPPQRHPWRSYYAYIWTIGFKAAFRPWRHAPVRRWRLWRHMADYFSATLVKTGSLDPSRNYIFTCHPHGRPPGRQAHCVLHRRPLHPRCWPRGRPPGPAAPDVPAALLP